MIQTKMPRRTSEPTPERPHLAPSEFRVMLSLWRRGQARVDEVCEDLAERGHTLSYTTVLTLLQRLTAKGYVTTERISDSTTAYGYSPTVEKAPAVRQTAQRLLQEYQFDEEGLEIFRSVVEESLAKRPTRARRRTR